MDILKTFLTDAGKVVLAGAALFAGLTLLAFVIYLL